MVEYLAIKCMLKVDNRNTRKRYKLCSNDVILVSLLLTLTYFTSFSRVSVIDFELANFAEYLKKFHKK